MLKKLLEHFDAYENLPVEVDTVRDQILDLGIQDEIKFYFVEMDERVLRGLLYRYRRHAKPYADPTFCSDICISDSLSDAWKRLVAVKELLHITDTDAQSAESEEAVERLIEILSRPMEIGEIGEETNPSFNDKTQYISALAILVPKECRSTLRSLKEEGKITDVDIARIAKIPERFSGFVVHSGFENLVQAILDINQS